MKCNKQIERNNVLNQIDQYFKVDCRKFVSSTVCHYTSSSQLHVTLKSYISQDDFHYDKEYIENKTYEKLSSIDLAISPFLF